jgi:UDP:flavonoid glycosyltransferase YjiC (YdhE family)
MHGIINHFRKEILGLPSIHMHHAINIMIDERVPHTYCWSSALAPKPSDWGSHINVSGFFFLDLCTAYTNPPEDLLHFLGNNKLSPPIYIGFGSITGHDSRRLLGIVIDALEKSGYRALLSGLATDTDQLPDYIFKIDNVPHDWLFDHGDYNQNIYQRNVDVVSI